MYCNLKAEMARKGIKVKDIADLLGVRRATASDKINGKYRFYCDEAIKIKETFFSDLNIDYLFQFKPKNDHNGKTA